MPNLGQNQPSFFKTTDLKEPTKIPDLFVKPLETNKPTIDLNRSSPKPPISVPSSNPFVTTISAAAFQPPPLANNKSNTNLLLAPIVLPTQSITTIAPPIPVALSQPPPLSNPVFSALSQPPSASITQVSHPPTQTPPVQQQPPIQIGTNKPLSNPYSARGALNKKVYETQVTSVPVQAVNLPPPIQEIKAPAGNIYVPSQSFTPTPEQQQQQFPSTFIPPTPPTTYSTQSSYSSPTIPQQQQQDIIQSVLDQTLEIEETTVQEPFLNVKTSTDPLESIYSESQSFAVALDEYSQVSMTEAEKKTE